MKFEIGDEARVMCEFTEWRWGWGVITGPARDSSEYQSWMLDWGGWARPIPEQYLIGRSPLELLAMEAE